MGTHIRTVKPCLFRHEELFEAERKTALPLRLAFIGLFTVADREGRFRWRPREVKLDVLPYDETEMGEVLDALVKFGFAVKYTCKGEAYGWIPTFKTHQRCNVREPQSNLPAPDSNDSDACTHVQSTCTADAEQMQVAREGEVEGEVEGEKDVSSEANFVHSEPAPSPFIILPCVGNGRKDYTVTAEQIGHWREQFPGVDVAGELRHAQAWLEANPTRRKTAKGIPRFIVRWLGKSQDRPKTNTNRTSLADTVQREREEMVHAAVSKR